MHKLERSSEGLRGWMKSHIERMGDGRTAKKVYEGECMGSSLVDRPLKRWTV